MQETSPIKQPPNKNYNNDEVGNKNNNNYNFIMTLNKAIYVLFEKIYI